MYQPAHHREDRLSIQHEAIDTHSFGLLISLGGDGLLANGVPFLLHRSEGERGTLHAHIARANTQWHNLEGQKVLVVFQGPQSYISPSFYETKRETGKVVPTWNYVMVQARGIAKIHQDAAWLDKQVNSLTAKYEKHRTNSWAVSDAPRTYIESQLRGIIGIEIKIDSIEGKWKVSQNRNEADRQGVAEGLVQENAAMAELVKNYRNE